MKIKKTTKLLKKLRVTRTLTLSVVIILLYLISIFSFFLFYKNKIMPNLYVGNIYVGGLKKTEAESYYSSYLKIPESIKVEIDKNVFYVNLKEINFSYNIKETINNAYLAKRSGINASSIIFNEVVNLEPVYTFNNEYLDKSITQILAKTNVEPTYPYIFISEGSVGFDKGKEGKIIKKDEIIFALNKAFFNLDFSPVILNTKVVNVALNDKQEQAFKERGQKFVGKKIILTSNGQDFKYSDEKILELLNSGSGFNISKIDLVVYEIEQQLNREPQDSVFVFEEGKVKEFAPSTDGIKVDTNLLSVKIEESLNNFEQGSFDNSEEISIEIPLNKMAPKITTESINNLGIRELIGKGNSKFSGSITSRIHNISLASSKFNGVLIAPEEVFSFNKTLGDVSKYTGYKQAYIIRDGQTVLGDGGGVCQVSTTLFRALLNAGLPIVERRAHSYRVGYYEQGSPPGIDATVYDPTTDLKFKNDTPKYILIQTKVDTNAKTLVFELYGTSDGRVAMVGKPVISSSIAPPEDLYTDDPTLPAGQIKQIDYKAWGAKVNFKYSVERNGETIYEKIFFSNYQPWQAKFLRGTGPSS